MNNLKLEISSQYVNLDFNLLFRKICISKRFTCYAVRFLSSWVDDKIIKLLDVLRKWIYEES